MELVKMFNASEMLKELQEEDIYDYLDIPGNGCAVSHWVDKDENSPLDEYLLNHGCKDGEKVWIDISW